MAYLDYPGLAYFKSLLDENYLRTNYEGDTVIDGNVTFTEPVDASVKNDWLGQQIDKTYIKNLRPEDDGEVALIYGDNHEEVITIDTAVTQVRSDANEMYPILLCYDANAEVNQISKSVRYGHNVAINPAYGYVYANSYVVKHPTYNRTISSTTRVEWASDFRDSVLNPVGQIFEYIDPVSQGGEHRMEFRLYGNPNVAGINAPNINDETNTVSLGVSATRGDALTFFGYAPSTPIYLEDGSTMRKSLVRGDQYGKDIITRDWLNLNGSITGLVHTYMDETIDGYKTFLKTVTIDSGDDNNKAGLNVQGDVNIHGDEDIDGNLNIDGNETVGGDLGVDGTINKIIDGNTTQEYVTYVTSQDDTRKDIAAGLVDTTKGLAYNPSTGKIYVNANTSKGIGFGSDGKIYVDFTQIDDNTKASILAGLNMQVPLANNIILYVNPGASDDTDNQNLAFNTRITTPFTTIQGAIDWATSKLALGPFNVYINIVAGTYHESVELKAANTSSGRIILQCQSGNKNVIVEPNINSSGYYPSCFQASTGSCRYIIHGLVMKIHITSNSITEGPSAGCVQALTDGAIITLYDNDYYLIRDSANISGESCGIRVISADQGGIVYLAPGTIGSSFNTQRPTPLNDMPFFVHVLNVSRGGTLYLVRTANPIGVYTATGSYDVFCEVWQGGSVKQVGVGTPITFAVASGGSVSGKPYHIVTGSNILAPSGGFPHGENETGSVESSTYCWYA